MKTTAQTKTIGAAEAWETYRVTRAWLREQADRGLIRRIEVKGTNRANRPYTKNLYYVEDIERVLNSFRSRSQDCAAPRSAREAR